jgi:hypothetical protein
VHHNACFCPLIRHVLDAAPNELHNHHCSYTVCLPGLPELAKFYLADQNITAAKGLFKRVDPPTLEGLVSRPAGSKPRGYDRL